MPRKLAPALLAVLLVLPGCYSLKAQKRDLKEGRLELGRQSLEAFLDVWGEPSNHGVRILDTYDPYWVEPYWTGFQARRWGLGYGYHLGYHPYPHYARYRVAIDELYYDERNVIVIFENDRLMGYRPIRYLEPMKLGPKSYP